MTVYSVSQLQPDTEVGCCEDKKTLTLLTTYTTVLEFHPAKQTTKQDHQALIKAKYCKRVTTASCTQKTQKKRDLDLDVQQGSRDCPVTRACKISSG